MSPWAILAKATVSRIFGWFPSWILRRLFNQQRMKEGIHITLAANSLRFEILNIRPVPALCGVQIHLSNFLPFPIHANFSNIELSISSQQWLSQPLNHSMAISASSHTTTMLPEIQIPQRLVDFLHESNNGCVYVGFNVKVQITSKVYSPLIEPLLNGYAFVHR